MFSLYGLPHLCPAEVNSWRPKQREVRRKLIVPEIMKAMPPRPLRTLGRETTEKIAEKIVEKMMPKDKDVPEGIELKVIWPQKGGELNNK